MTEHTRHDFQNAEFARHADGRIAARIQIDAEHPWTMVSGDVARVRTSCSDRGMVTDGWRILYTSPFPHEQPRPLTASEHLDAAWEAAYEPEGHIPANTEMIVRTVGDGRIAKHIAGAKGAAPETWAGESLIWKRRLLDPPEPQRPEGLTTLIEAIRTATYDPEPVATGEALYSAGVRVTTEEDR